jgi:Leucine-rich repeat (LRR) protein
MNKLSKDILFLICIKLEDKDLTSFFKSNKYVYEQICKKDHIWNYKLKEYSENFEIKSSKELYLLIKSLDKAKKTFRANLSLKQLYDLDLLKIWYGSIEKIPNLSLFKNLKKLSLCEHKIEEIPETLPDSLQLLSLEGNRINKIPDKLPKNLEWLWLDSNLIKEIPNNLPNSLDELDLSNNKIEKIPDTLPCSLRNLYLPDNQIKELPNTLPDSLRLLDLKRNKVEKIPKKYEKIIYI